MTEQVLITLIIAAAVVLVVFRDRLSAFGFKISPKGGNASMKTHGPGVTISDVKQMGKENVIEVNRSNVHVQNVEQRGGRA